MYPGVRTRYRGPRTQQANWSSPADTLKKNATHFYAHPLDIKDHSKIRTVDPAKFHYEGPKGAAHVEYDTVTGGHEVSFWKRTDSGLKRHEPDDYFTMDKKDAHSTAKKMVGKSVNESSLTSEAIITLVKSIKDKKSKMSDEAMAKKNQ